MLDLVIHWSDVGHIKIAQSAIPIRAGVSQRHFQAFPPYHKSLSHGLYLSFIDSRILDTEQLTTAIKCGTNGPDITEQIKTLNAIHGANQR